MAWTPARDKGAFNPKGGGIIKIWGVDDTGATPSTVYDIGYIQDSVTSDATPTDTFKDEAGDTVQVIEGDREVMVSGTLMQRDKLTLDMAEEVRGNFYGLYKYMGIINGKYQEIFYGLGKVTPQFNITLQGGTTPFEYKATKCQTTVTIAAASLTASHIGAYTTATVTIAAGDYYTIVETTVT